MKGNRFKATWMTANKIKGFTLIELVVGILVLGIALVMMTSMLFPQADRAAFTLHRVRSAELAHSLLNEIWGKRYDENTNANGGVPACGSPSGNLCSATLGPDGVASNQETRNDFDDVDDYSGLTITSDMLNSSQTYGESYSGYQLSVTVTYPDAPSRNTKLIRVDVSTPSGEVITYHAQRSNY